MPAKRKDNIGTTIFGSMPTVANLATLTVGVSATPLTLQQTATILKARLFGRFLPDTTDCPILVGLASDELSAAEIEAYLELLGPDEPAQISEAEIISRGRFIKPLGMVPGHGEIIANDSYSVEFQESVTLTIREGHGVQLWAYNLGAGPLGAASAFVGRCLLTVRWHGP